MSEIDDCDRKIEKPTNTCHENVEQYLTDSSLHGLRYVGNRKISYFERYFALKGTLIFLFLSVILQLYRQFYVIYRTFFALSFIFVMFLSGYFISNIWQKWSVSPMIIALNSKSTSIGDIPFPAVTICKIYSS